jgi:MICOS complex subunit MIC60
LTTFAYGGAVWYAFQSDNFHDFFTEYFPGGAQTIQAIQDYQFKQQYPHTQSIRKGERVSDLARKGPHISAIEANRPEVIEQKKEDAKKEKAEAAKKKEDKKLGKGEGKSEEEQKGPTIQLVPKTSTPPQTSDAAKENLQGEPPAKRDPAGSAPQAAEKPATPSTPTPASETTKDTKASKERAEKSRSKPVATQETAKAPEQEQKERTSAPTTPSQARLEIDFLDISPSDPSLEKLTSAINDLIKSFNSTATYDSTSAPLYEFLKSSVADLNSRFPEILASTRAEAEAQVQAQAQYFNQLHEELTAAMMQERNLMANEWMEAFDRERDALQERYNQRLEEELKKQGEVNDQRLENELLEQAIGLRRRWMREIQSQVETERGGRLSKLAALEKALTDLTGLHSDAHSVISKGEKGKKTAIAVQALKDAALNRSGGFVSELAALKTISNNDDFVRAIIASIDPEAYSKGIASQAELAARFQNLAHELRKISLLPEDAGVAGHAASWLLSQFMFKQRGYVRGDDVESRLARVEALLEAGKLDDATREVNSFSGWGRELSKDWLRDARKRLEVLQAIDVNSSFHSVLTSRYLKLKQHWTRWRAYREKFVIC